MGSVVLSHRRVLTSALLLALLAACSDSSDTTTPSGDTGILSITAGSVSLLVGETTSLRVAASAGTAKISWTSSNEAVARVDTSGAVTAIAPGIATIRATAGGKSASVDMTVSASAPMLAVSASYVDVCAITTVGALHCAGKSYGSVPVAIAPTLRFKAGRGFGAPSPDASSNAENGFCAIAIDDTAYCWGSNEFGQLGVGDTQPHTAPTAVAGGLHFKTLAPGDAIACGITLDGKGYCWGAGASGAIGDSQVMDRATPTAVQLDVPLADISTGNFTGGGKNGPNGYSCALTTDGKLYCWGGNTTGQLGDNNVPSSNATPHAAATSVTFASLSQSNTLFACALTADGTPYCWGNGEPLQVQNLCAFPGGVHACLPIPTQIATPLRFTALSAASGGGMCGVTRNREVACWGTDINDRFGSAATVPCANGCGSNPIITMAGFSTVSTSVNTTCGIAANQRAYCWGDNNYHQITPLAFGQLGVPTLFRVPASGSP